MKKEGSQYCVVKKGTSQKVAGGCHDTRKEAIQHMKALYKNVHAAEMTMEKMEDSEFYAIRNVPIVSTGIEYPLSTGNTTFTPEDLADAVKAMDDPGIVAPRLKLGHSDGRFNGDGEPALGRVENLRLDENAHTIMGDYVGLPEWLANLLPSAYPSRSIEGNFDVETVTGNKYRLVISAVSLLGVSWPGVQTLDDLPVLFSAAGPEGVTLEAAMNVEDIRRQYYDHLTAQGHDYDWWWIRAMQLDPSELIVDDDNGTLYRVPFDIDGDDLSFGDPVAVKVKYVDMPKSQQDKQAASNLVFAGIAAAAEGTFDKVYESRAEAGRSKPQDQEGGSVLDLKQLRASLGLADDASDDEVIARVKELRAEAEADDADQPDADDAAADPNAADESADDADDDAEKNEADDEAPADAEASVIRLDKAAYDSLKEGAALAKKHEADAIMATNDRILSEAVRAGKFPPARREHYAKLLAGPDRDGTIEFINSLSPGVVPVHETGHSHDVEGSGATGGEGLPESWFPEIGRKRATVSASRVTQAKEG